MNGIDFLRSNSIQNKICNTTRPFVFFSYAHNEHDVVIVRSLFNILTEYGFNIWLDIANIPYDEKSWKNAAHKALLSKNCKGIVFFRSEYSLVRDTVLDELKLMERLDKIGTSVTADIWEDENLSAEGFVKLLSNQVAANEVDYSEFEVCDSICKIIKVDNSALRFSADYDNDILKFSQQFFRVLSPLGIENKNLEEYDYIYDEATGKWEKAQSKTALIESYVNDAHDKLQEYYPNSYANNKSAVKAQVQSKAGTAISAFFKGISGLTIVLSACGLVALIVLALLAVYISKSGVLDKKRVTVNPEIMSQAEWDSMDSQSQQDIIDLHNELVDFTGEGEYVGDYDGYGDVYDESGEAEEEEEDVFFPMSDELKKYPVGSPYFQINDRVFRKYVNLDNFMKDFASFAEENGYEYEYTPDKLISSKNSGQITVYKDGESILHIEYSPNFTSTEGEDLMPLKDATFIEMRPAYLEYTGKKCVFYEPLYGYVKSDGSFPTRDDILKAQEEMPILDMLNIGENDDTPYGFAEFTTDIGPIYDGASLELPDWAKGDDLLLKQFKCFTAEESIFYDRIWKTWSPNSGDMPLNADFEEISLAEAVLPFYCAASADKDYIVYSSGSEKNEEGAEKIFGTDCIYERLKSMHCMYAVFDAEGNAVAWIGGVYRDFKYYYDASNPSEFVGVKVFDTEEFSKEHLRAMWDGVQEESDVEE